MTWLGKIQVFFLIFLFLDQSSLISKLKKAYIEKKIKGEAIKSSLLTFEQFWQHEKGKLTSDKFLHQMGGLIDDNKALSSGVKHIWMPF